MKNILKNTISVVMCCSLVLAGIVMYPTTETEAKAKKVALSKKSVTLTVGKSASVTLKNVQKKVQWKVVKGKNNVTIKKSGKLKNKIKITAKKKGKATIKGVYKKKSYQISVTINAAKKQNTKKQTIRKTTTPVAETPETESVQPGLRNMNEGRMEYTWKQLVESGIVTVSGSTLTGFINMPGFSNELIISDEITEIGTEAFKDSDVCSVVLPKSVKKIGAFAFKNCLLLNLKLNEGLEEIGQEAFFNCMAIDSLEIPSTVNYIDANAFKGAASLQKLTVSSNNQTYDSRNQCNAIIEKESNKLICAIGTSTIPSGVEIIGARTFLGSAKQSIEIPNSVKTIEDAAFQASSLKEIVLPNSVVTIGTGAFSNCQNLTTVTLGNHVETIGQKAFYEDALLEDVQFPESLKTIKENAFSKCNTINTVAIPKGVEIGLGAFKECSGIQTVSIETECSLLGNTFEGCGKLKNLTLKDGIKKMGWEVFKKCIALSEVHIPEGLEKLPMYGFEDCRNLSTVYLPKSLTSIANCNTFEGCSLKKAYYAGTSAEWKQVEGYSSFVTPMEYLG